MWPVPDPTLVCTIDKLTSHHLMDRQVLMKKITALFPISFPFALDTLI